MKSIADDLRDESRRKVLGMTPGERIELALRLGDEDVTRLAAARGITPDEARLVIERSRQEGRLPSRCARR